MELQAHINIAGEKARIEYRTSEEEEEELMSPRKKITSTNKKPLNKPSGGRITKAKKNNSTTGRTIDNGKFSNTTSSWSDSNRNSCGDESASTSMMPNQVRKTSEVKDRIYQDLRMQQDVDVDPSKENETGSISSVGESQNTYAKCIKRYKCISMAMSNHGDG